jgi:hypothetical protein
VPPFPPGAEWVRGEAADAGRLAAAAPLLVHFYDFAQLNSRRALPYVLAWRQRYEPHGLAVIGVHSPRFPFTRPAQTVGEAARGLGISHPVLVDSEHRAWNDYGCRGWPSLFLWGRGGALRWYHLGEGEYEATEEAIRRALEEAGTVGDWPPPLAPIRPSDAADAVVMAPSDELFPGGSPEVPWRSSPGEGSLRLEYEAGGAYATLDGRGSLRFSLDGEAPITLDVQNPGLHELAAHPRHERHTLEIEVSERIELYSLSFAPGTP